MSRAQESAVNTTAGQQNQGYYTNEKNSYTQAQQDVGDYSDNLAKYAASNPYVQGGQYQTSTNQQLANTADAGAQAAGQALQSQALREGGNTSGAVAATEAMQQSNTRDLAAEEAAQNQKRIAAGADYGKSVLQASEVPEQMEASLAGQQGNLAAGALNTQQKAGETPSWSDEFGDAFGQSLGKAAGSGVSSLIFGA